jgi:phospho-N-acetylmuramoyl-pentapeptide-transferase
MIFLMNLQLSFLLIAAILTGVLLIPFIHLLYNLHFQNPAYTSKDFLGRTSLFNRLHGWKKGTPTGAGILMMTVVIVVFLAALWLNKIPITAQAVALVFSAISFGLLGLYDDLTKFFQLHNKKWGLKTSYKLILQMILGLVIGYILQQSLGMDSIRLPVIQHLWQIGPIQIGGWYMFIAAATIVFTSNAFNITDGMDGLSAGLLIIALVAFWVITPGWLLETRLMIAILLGVLLPYLYFNIYPERVLMGDSGALPLGALLATIALLTDHILILPIIGGIFYIEISSSLMQIASFKWHQGKRLFLIAPLHHHLEALGWPETKVTMRLWLGGAVLALLGLAVATFGR